MLIIALVFEMAPEAQHFYKNLLFCNLRYVISEQIKTTVY